MKPNNEFNLEKDNYRTIFLDKDLVDTIKEKLGDEFLWDYDEKNNALFLIKKPDSYTDFLAGLGQEMWEKAGGVDYIRKEREEWID